MLLAYRQGVVETFLRPPDERYFRPSRIWNQQIPAHKRERGSVARFHGDYHYHAAPASVSANLGCRVSQSLAYAQLATALYIFEQLLAFC